MKCCSSSEVDELKYDPSDLKNLGLKATAPRLRILALFQKAALTEKRHLTADEVFSLLREEGEDVGLATVYRVLTQFEVAGLLRRHHFDSESASYELGEPEHHDHLVSHSITTHSAFMAFVKNAKKKTPPNRQRFFKSCPPNALALIGSGVFYEFLRIGPGFRGHVGAGEHPSQFFNTILIIEFTQAAFGAFTDLRFLNFQMRLPV